MSNIIILAGSERKDGNTDMLVDAFKKGAAKKNKVEVISVSFTEEQRIFPHMGMVYIRKTPL